MRSRWISALSSALAVSAVAVSAQGAEPYLPFIQGLRERGYYDYALHYLDQIEQEAKTPAEIRRIVPYERAMTLLQGTTLTRNPDERAAQLEQASKLFEEFVKANPADPRSARADSERARILLDRARVQVWQSLAPANEGRKAELQEEARGLIDQAQQIYQAAHDKFQATYEAFPKGPPADRAETETRKAVEVGYVQAQVELARCDYERAQTYAPGSPERLETLKQAALRFEAIHIRYRTMTAGLMASLWQGKCFEEMDEIGKALGIYNALLEHDSSKSVPLRNLQFQAQHFQLICLNHALRNEFQVVSLKATDWLNANARYQRTRPGIGIRWERARAYEQLSLGREVSAADRDKLLKQARDDARFVRNVEGPYRDQAALMERRLELLLSGEDAKPQDFETAVILANSYIRRVGELDTRHRGADGEAKTKIKQDLDAQLAETVPMLHLALELAGKDADPQQVNLVRSWLGYVELLSGRSLEAAVIGGFIARKYARQQPETAMNAAYLAIGAYDQAYRNAPEDDRSFELERLVEAGEFLAVTWPDSDKANEARLRMGQLFRQRDQSIEAAHWYSQIPPTAFRYAEAQREAGQSYWRGYLVALELPEAERPPTEDLDKWQAAAEKHLLTAIEKYESGLSEKAVPSHDFARAKVTLVQIANNRGDYPRAIELLTDGPRPVVEAIKVEDEAERPATGIKSPAFAGLVYQMLLRAYVGDRRIDEALAAMDALERVGGEDNIAIYVQLGRELQHEIERLDRSENKMRLNDVLASFEEFLTRLYDRKEGQNYSSMIWISETYFGLGEGLESDREAAARYFEKAANTYQAILDRAAQEGDDFVSADRLPGVRLRLVNCRRRQGKFEKALDLALEVLGEKPNVLAAQFEAASVLEDWAASGQVDSPEKYLEAITGRHFDRETDKVHVWGWATTAIKIESMLNQQGPDPALEQQRLDARYHISSSRRRYALTKTKTDADRRKQLEKASAEIVAFSRIGGEMDDEWWRKFDSLYRLVQSDLGVAQPKPLERPAPLVIQAPAAQATPAAAVADAGAAPAPTGGSAEEGSGVLIAVVGLLLAAAAGAGVFFMMGGTGRRRRPNYSGSAEAKPARPAAPRQPAAAGAAPTRGAAPGKSSAGGPRKPPRPRSTT